MKHLLAHPAAQKLRDRLIDALAREDGCWVDQWAHAIAIEIEKAGGEADTAAVVADAQRYRPHASVLAKLRVQHLPPDWAEVLPPARDYVIESIAPRGKVSALIGAGNVGKSTLFADAMPCVALGLRWRSDLDVTQGSIAVVSWEDEMSDYAARLFGAARAWPECRSRAEEVRQRLHFVPMHGTGLHLVDSVAGRATVGGLAESLALRLQDISDLVWVVIETASRASAADEMNEGMARLVEAGELVAQRLNIAVTISHHVTKTAIVAGSLDATAARGGSALVDNCRATTIVAKIERDSPVALFPPGLTAADVASREILVIDNVRTSYARRAPRFWVERRYTPEGMPYLRDVTPAVAADGDGASPLQQADDKFAEFLRGRMGSDCHSERAITRDWFEEHGLGERKARGALSRLVSAGVLVREYRRQYGDKGRLVTMYRLPVAS